MDSDGNLNDIKRCLGDNNISEDLFKTKSIILVKTSKPPK